MIINFIMNMQRLYFVIIKLGSVVERVVSFCLLVVFCSFFFINFSHAFRTRISLPRIDEFEAIVS